MAGTNRAATSGLELLADLRDNATRYDFFQAIRLLENLHPDRPPMGSSQKAIDDPVRLGQEPSLAFAPSTLAEFNHSTPGAKPRLNVRFFGLFGPNGPLPLHLTEYARDRIRNHKDLTLTRFLDVFHHRLLSLFYRAWSDVQPVVQLERGEYDRFSCYVASLFGCGTEDYLDRDALPQRAKLYHAGHLATQTRHAEGLRSILADYFQLPVQIEEFIGQWVELPDNCRCTIGGLGQTASLGRAATIGSHIWDCQQKFRITIGPVSWDDYQRLLPGEAGLTALVAAVRNYVGDELMWDVNLVLKASQLPGLRLGQCGQLGRSTWLCPDSVTRDAADLIVSPADHAIGRSQYQHVATDDNRNDHLAPADDITFPNVERELMTVT